MSPQTLFDTVVAALRAQGRKSQAPDENGLLTCAYRAPQPDGTVLKCAAGHILPDALYEPDMEGKCVDGYHCESIFQPLVGAANMSLLRSLQSSHDHFEIAKWEDEWWRIATARNLTYTPPTQPSLP